MNGQLVRADPSALAEQVAVTGDLSKLSPAERMNYYGSVCASLHLNPLTRPFDYLTLNGKLILYAKRECADQLRQIHGVSITKIEQDVTADMVIVTAYARTADGREDADIGAVAIGTVKGEAMANARMKALTKAKRRVTLSICGLGWLDESEIDAIPSARTVEVDTDTGEIIEPRFAAIAAPAKPFDPAEWRARYQALPDAPLAGPAVISNTLDALDTATGIPTSGLLLARWGVDKPSLKPDLIQTNQVDALKKTAGMGSGKLSALVVAATKWQQEQAGKGDPSHADPGVLADGSDDEPAF